MQRQSFWQQIRPLTNGMPQVKPLLATLVEGVVGFRIWSDSQSLSCEQLAEQKGPVSTVPDAPCWTTGLRQMRLGHSRASALKTP